MTTDRDWDQTVNLSAAAWDPYTISWVMDTRAGINVVNHTDKHVDALIDRMKEAATQEMFRQAGYDFQQYVGGEYDAHKRRLGPVPAGSPHL